MQTDNIIKDADIVIKMLLGRFKVSPVTNTI